MSDLKPEYHDREILEEVAAVEVAERPYEYEVAGVEWEDIEDAFAYEDFGTHPMSILPKRLKDLSEEGYLE